MADIVDMGTRAPYVNRSNPPGGGGDDMEARVKSLEGRADRLEGKIDTLIEKVARMEGEVHRLPGYPGLFAICGTLVAIVALLVRFLPAPPV